MNMNRLCARDIAAALAFTATVALGGAAVAQSTYFQGDTGRAQESRAGHGEFSLTYQHGHYNGAKASFGVVSPVGEVDAHALYPQIDFSVTDRLSLQAGVPIFVVRYQGDRPHRHPGDEHIDNGSYHGAVQDILLGARYLVRDQAFRIEPFVLMTIPSHDYPVSAHSSIGLGLLKGEVGSTFSYKPPFDDWYVSASGSHVFSEHPLGINIDHWKAEFEAGYFLAPNFAVRALLLAKQGKGLSRPRDFIPFDPELEEHHDQLLKNNYVNAGVGFDWFLDGGRRVSGTAIRMIQSEDTHILKYGFLVTIGQSF